MRFTFARVVAVILTASAVITACTPQPKAGRQIDPPPSVSAEQRFSVMLQQASSLRIERKFDQAAALARDVLQTQEKLYGPDDPRLIPALNELVAASCAGGKCPNVGPFYRHLLRIREKSLGPDHPDVAASLALLGEVEQLHGRYADAEKLFERALTIRERAFGKDSVLARATQVQLQRCRRLEK